LSYFQISRYKRREKITQEEKHYKNSSTDKGFHVSKELIIYRMLDIITCLSKLPTGQFLEPSARFLIQCTGSILLEKVIYFTQEINCKHDALFAIQYKAPFCCKTCLGGESVFQIY